MKPFLIISGALWLAAASAAIWFLEHERSQARARLEEARLPFARIEPRLREIEDARTLRAAYWQKRFLLEQPRAVAHSLAEFGCFLNRSLPASMSLDRFRFARLPGGWEFVLEGTVGDPSAAAARRALQEGAAALGQFPELVLLSSSELGDRSPEKPERFFFRIRGMLGAE